jgi:hypothetical protein
MPPYSAALRARWWQVDPHDRDAGPVLLDALKDPSSRLVPTSNRVKVVKSLGEMGLDGKALLPVLHDLARGEDRRSAWPPPRS